MEIHFQPAHPSNRWKILALRPIDLISQAMKNTGSKSASLVSLEIWRLLSQILYGVEPGELSLEASDKISDLLFDQFGILFIRDVQQIIEQTLNSRQEFATISLSSN